MSFAWRVSGSSSGYETLPWRPVGLKLVASAPATDCLQNLRLPSACVAGTSCALQTRPLDTTCLGNALECPSGGLYEVPACSPMGNDTCGAGLVYERTYYNNAGSAYSERCCSESDLDCAGKCYGGASMVSSAGNSNALFCCSATVDCAGVCGGSAATDACGLCQGSDTTGTSCGNIIGVEGGGGNISTTISASEQAGVLNRYVTVSNDQSSPVNLRIATVSPFTSTPAAFGPDLTYFTGNSAGKPLGPGMATYSVALPAYSNITAWINVSVGSMLDGSKPWTTKAIVISYQRTSITQIFIEASRIGINIDISNCSVVTSGNICTGLPGCSFCFGKMPEYVKFGVGTIRTRKTRRRLFLDIIPYLTASEEVINLDGVCVDGRDANVACPLALSYNTAGASKTLLNWALSFVALIFVSFILQFVN